MRSLSWIVAGLVIASAASGCGRSAGSASLASPPEPPTAQPSVAVQVLDFAGIEQLVASHRGQVVVMDAWSLACPPCTREFPKLVELHRRYENGLACISLSFDYEGIGEPADKLPRVTEFLKKHGATFDNVLASDESDVLYRKFHLFSVPAVFVYDKAGVLRQRFDNQQAASEADAFSYEDVDKLVGQLLAEPTTEASGQAADQAQPAESPAG